LIEDRRAGDEDAVIERRWETRAARGPSTIFVPVREQSLSSRCRIDPAPSLKFLHRGNTAPRALRISPIGGAFLGILIYAEKLNMSEGT
jgi:hypothetical protein